VSPGCGSLWHVRSACEDQPDCSDDSTRRKAEIPVAGPSAAALLLPFDCPHPCRGWPASGPGRLAPDPWLLTGGGAEAPRSRVAKRPFPKETQRALDGGGAPPHTKRAIPGPSLGAAPYRRGVADDQLGRRVPALHSAGMLRRRRRSGRFLNDRCCPWGTVRDRCYGHAEGTAGEDHASSRVAAMVTT
jgi:hypothetical protein